MSLKNPQVRLISDEITQTVKVTHKQPIIIKCNCLSKKLHTSSSNTLTLRIQGYFPKSQAHKAIFTKDVRNLNTHPLRFSVKEYKEYIVLESQEYARKRNTFGIDKIEVTAPMDSPIHLLPADTSTHTDRSTL